MKSTPLNSHLLAGVIALTAVFLLIHPCDASGQSRTTLSLPEFLPGQRLMADGKELRVTYQSGSTTNFNYYSVPCVMDWNGDGKKDLLTGAFYYGNIYLYLNSGADSAPILISSGKIRADGYDLHVDYGWCMGAYPQVADWNNDSLPDLLVGDSSGRITLFLNRGTFTNPSLTNSGFIRANNNYLDVGLRAAPVVTDWNDDGRKDLIVGEENGSVRLYLNSGTDEQPFFDDWTVIYAGDYPIQHFRSSPDVGDIDGDGLNDLVIAENNGYVYIYKNIGTENNPLFGQGERASVEGSAYVWVYYGARMDLNDWDNDGDLDLLIGDRNAYITLFLNQLISTGVDPSGSSAIPVELALYPNHPNPFNSTTQIRYALPEAGSVRLAIHDIRGRTIRTLVDSRQGPGVKTVCWNGRSERGHTVSSGLYLVVLTTGNRQITRKITLLR